MHVDFELSKSQFFKCRFSKGLVAVETFSYCFWFYVQGSYFVMYLVFESLFHRRNRHFSCFSETSNGAEVILDSFMFEVLLSDVLVFESILQQ